MPSDPKICYTAIDRIRHEARPPPRFWFLPATAAAALFLGLSAFHAEEDPNDQFVYDRTESVLHLSLDAPGGTSLSPYDSPVAVGVLLERYSWQIWRQPSTGLEEYREPGTVPESGATATLTRSPEMGTLAESTLITRRVLDMFSDLAPESRD